MAVAINQTSQVANLSYRYTDVSMSAPRGEAARQRIISATSELLLERGLAAFTVEAVAAASGAARSTIYRHWPEPRSLLVETLTSMIRDFPTPDNGDLRADLLSFADMLRSTFDDPRVRRLLLDLTREAVADPELREILETAKQERRQPVQLILQRAMARGDIDPEIDLDLAVHLVEGPLMSASVLQNRPMTDAAAAEMVTRIVKALS